MSELADSAIDHIGKFLDNTGIRDYVWVACWLFGTYSIYMFLLAQKMALLNAAKTENEYLAWLREHLTFSIWLFGIADKIPILNQFTGNLKVIIAAFVEKIFPNIVPPEGQ